MSGCESDTADLEAQLALLTEADQAQAQVQVQVQEQVQAEAEQEQGDEQEEEEEEEEEEELAPLPALAAAEEKSAQDQGAQEPVAAAALEPEVAADARGGGDDDGSDAKPAAKSSFKRAAPQIGKRKQLLVSSSKADVVTVDQGQAKAVEVAALKPAAAKSVKTKEVPSKLVIKPLAADDPKLGQVEAPVSKKKAKDDTGGAASEKKPTALSSYQIFCSERRADVKKDLPEGAKLGEISSKLGELWKSMGAVERQQYDERADADKKEKAPLIAAWKASHPEEKKAKRKGKEEGKKNDDREGAEGKKRKKQRQSAKATDSAAEADEEEIQQQNDQDGEGVEAAPNRQSHQGDQKKSAGSKKKASKKRREKTAADAEELAAETEASDKKRRRPSEESEDEEWGWDDEAEAALILSKSLDGKSFVVAVKNAGWDSIGLVDAHKVKMQRLEGADSRCPVTVEMLDEFEAYEKRFKAEVIDRYSRTGSMDLDDLPEGSLLETCYLLGKLREPNQVLSKCKPQKGQMDSIIHVPAMALSFTVQRLVDAERHKVARLEAQLAKAKQLLAANKVPMADL